ncbi:MAG: SIR2 family protein [Pseudomonadota bacterium]
MRFYLNGPDIPNDLIDAQSQGRVVFFCGAGISMPAGLPSFLVLTKRVMDKLGVSSQALNSLSVQKREINGLLQGHIHSLQFSLDQTFYLLQQEYGSEAVEQEVNDAVRINRKTDTSNHKTIIRLAKGKNQQPQLVTTNYDLLFEYAHKGLKSYTPPGMPDLHSGQLLDGLIYLHGRWSKDFRKQGAPDSLIISSADFGRAYLVNGWASRFIKQLASRYTIVLLGYSADDPPVRYLLEGLHTANIKSEATIYAFDRGTKEDVDGKWEHRGVRGISFPGFDDLWNSLNAWADFSENPSDWNQKILNLARQNPKELSPVERGQVAHLVSSTNGAKLFSECNPPPCAEWLCVFDGAIRNAEEITLNRFSFNEPPQTYTPNNIYGLDSDICMLSEDGRLSQIKGYDLLNSITSDDTPCFQIGLCAYHQRNNDLPPRLAYLTVWISKILHDPVTIWWCIGKNQLNPNLLAELRRALYKSESSLLPAIHANWLLIIEYFNHNSDFGNRYLWEKFVTRTKTDGWNNYTLRKLERILQPYLCVYRESKFTDQPPTVFDPENPSDNILRIEIRFPHLSENLPTIPEDHLIKVLPILRKSFDRALNLIDHVGYYHAPSIWNKDALYSTAKGEEILLRYFINFFDRLAVVAPEQARREVSLWPKNDPHYFDQLRIHAWGIGELFSKFEIYDGLKNMSDQSFWNSEYEFVIINLMKSIWSDLSIDLQEVLSSRVVDGPYFKNEKHPQRYFYSVVSRLGSLQRTGCVLPENARHCLEELRTNTLWTEALENQTSLSPNIISGIVRANIDHAVLDDISISEITAIDDKNSEIRHQELTEDQPFRGLVSAHPSRALRALTIRLKNNEYPIRYWSDILNQWPSNQKPRLVLLLALRLLNLPLPSFEQLSYSIAHWYKNHLSTAINTNPEHALDIWDKTIDKFYQLEESALQSSIGNTYSQNKLLKRSRRTIEFALNSPIGAMTDALFSLVNLDKHAISKRLPDVLKKRISKLLEKTGESRDHFVVVLMRRINYLLYIDPKWTKHVLLPCFDIRHELCEPAWNGLLTGDQNWTFDLFTQVKPHLYDVLEAIQTWCWDNDPLANLHHQITIACYRKRNNQSYLLFSEAREYLQCTNEHGRTSTLWLLWKMIRSGDPSQEKFVQHFVQRAWPRELRYLSPATTRFFIYLAEDAGENFEEIINLILPFLVPFTNQEIIFSQNTESTTSSLATLYPASMLKLLYKVCDEKSMPPYDINEILNEIEAASQDLAKDSRYTTLRKLANQIS